MSSNPVIPRNAPHIVVTTSDFERLQRVVSIHEGAGVDSLDIELARAEIIDPREVPGDVVTMNSEVVSEDAVTGVKRVVRIVYPEDADVQQGRVSVLAPLGSALLGLRVGQEIEWRMPQGIRRLRVVAVPYQPEANGHFHL
jgi:regulator of nucleoside diphosphate kinase